MQGVVGVTEAKTVKCPNQQPVVFLFRIASHCHDPMFRDLVCEARNRDRIPDNGALSLDLPGKQLLFRIEVGEVLYQS